MTTSFKVNLDKQANAILPEEPVHQGKWCNLVFLKDGSFYKGSDTHDSEKIALELHLAWKSEVESSGYPHNKILIHPNDAPSHLMTEYAYCLQMPIREGGA